ncbi:MAG: RNA polymerase sigma factor [Pirellulales bacterium]
MNGPAETIRFSRDGPLAITDFDEFAAQYRQAFPRLRLIAAAIINDSAHAEDIVQEAALIAVSKAAQFRAGSSFSAWLAAIVRHCALNYRRKIQTRKTFATDPTHLAQYEDQTVVAGGVWPSVGANGEVLPFQASFDDELVGALNALGDDARCCLLLRIVQRLSYAEISDLLQIPEGTAMSHVHRGKQALRQRLSSPNRTPEQFVSPPK